MTDEEKVLDALSKPFCHMVIDINHITNISKNKIRDILDDLIAAGKVALVNKNYYLQKKGIIEIKDPGFGFIKVDGEEEEYYVERDMNNGAYTGDEVLFYILPKTGRQKKNSAIVLKILKHSNEYIYGLLVFKKNKKGTKYQIISYNKDFDIKATVKKEDLNGALDGNIVVGKVDIQDGEVYASVIKIVGHKDDPGVDISLIALEYGFELEFPAEVKKEASLLDKYVDADKYKKRKDLRDDLIITIDGDDSKDFDDAVNVRRMNNGNYLLSVHIADVSEYVKKDTYLDKEAFKRGTSVYLADRVIPMLPRSLSNGICSINEGEDRLALTCEMEIDSKGDLITYDIYESIINSSHRMTYKNVNLIINGDEEKINEYSDIVDMVKLMVELSDIIRNKRVKNGSLDFDIPEYKAVLNKRCEPIGFKKVERDKAEMLIEDFMLMANETVAYHLNKLDMPCVYRIHEEASEEKILNVFSFVKELGIDIKKTKAIYPQQIQSVMNQVKEKTDSYEIVNSLLLRAMMKAKYSEKCIGHYGLGLKYYCHFTSPIRRYPDLIVHRILKTLVLHPTKHFDNDYMDMQYSIKEIAEVSSEQERKSVECEREVNDMLASVYMQRHIGEEFEGKISSVTQFGMFVEIEGGIEGLVHINNMDGYFIFDDKKMTLSSYNKTYMLGDKVKIIVVGSSKKDRAIDFMLEDDYYREDDYFGNGYNRFK